MTMDSDCIINSAMCELLEELETIPGKIQKILDDKERIQWFASKYANSKDIFLMSNHLLFLHDHRVPATNNESERLQRSYKRKQQAVSLRSFEIIEYLCQCMSMFVQMRQKEEMNLFNRVSQIFV